MSNKLIKPFAIVEFDELINNKKSVELVPISWLSENEAMCFWPPKDEERNVPKLVELECAPGSTWRTYQVEVLSKAKGYEQGLRRLNRSFRKKDVASSDSDETQVLANSQLLLMDSLNVARALANPVPISSQQLDDILEEDANIIADDTNHITSHKSAMDNQEIGINTASGPRVERKGIVDFDGLAVHLEKFISAELDKMKRSLLLTMASKCDKILKAVEYKADPPQKTQAWKEIGENLPFENLENFLEFDASLKTDEKKQNALVDIFQMAAAGCASYEADVPAIMAKLMKKDVQIMYSGCGKKSKGVGKRSFKETETFKIVEKFLTAKYWDSKEKLKIVSAISRYLSGANDRDGGRARRY